MAEYDELEKDIIPYFQSTSMLGEEKQRLAKKESLESELVDWDLQVYATVFFLKNYYTETILSEFYDIPRR